MAEVDASIIKIIDIFLDKLNRSGITVEEAYLFGSHARGSADKWSDIDIAIISSSLSNDRFDERLRLMKLASEIDSRIEPVPFRADTFIDEDPLVWEIKKEGISIKTPSLSNAY